MLQIRKSAFETNSSSTHSMCIYNGNEDEIRLPSEVNFVLDDFGWEHRKLDSMEEKASYIYTLSVDLEDKNFIENIWKWFGEDDIDCNFESEKEAKDKGKWFGVDHCSDDDGPGFYKYVMRSKKHLYKYLFSDKSYIITGNDNDDDDVSINENYSYVEFFKGN